jgi:lysozyme
MLDTDLVEAVKRFEGFAPLAKWDYKQYTNGFGTRAHSKTEHISETEAQRRLVIELTAAQALVDHFAPGAPQGVRNALTSLTFNEGTGWEHDGLGEAVKAKNWGMAKAHFLMYDHAGDKVLPALEKRRAEEASWFPKEDHPVEATPAAQSEPVVDPVAPPEPVTTPDGKPTKEAAGDPTTGGSLLSRAIHSIEAAL